MVERPAEVPVPVPEEVVQERRRVTRAPIFPRALPGRFPSGQVTGDHQDRSPTDGQLQASVGVG
ncbi:MAG: hypothetical protein ACYC1D_13020 [Acidimicrobiales bacterium]